jgi:phosphatidylglycerol:prolipoprotein diacylglycerol transferase
VLSIIRIDINPVAFHVGSLAVHWYGVMYVIAFAVAYQFAALPHLLARGVRRDQAERIAGWAILFGLIGARLYYVAQQNLSPYLHNPLQILAVWDGGMAFFGAIIGALLTLAVLAWRYKLPVWTVLDAGAFFAVVGQPIGRIGNLINGDILGGPSNLPWATMYINPNAVLQSGYSNLVAYQPAAAYEALGTILIAVVLLLLRRRRVRPGVVIIAYVALYAASQILLDFLRESEPVIWLGLKQLQLTSIVALVIGVPLLVLVWRRTEGRAGTEEEDPGGAGLPEAGPAEGETPQAAPS